MSERKDLDIGPVADSILPILFEMFGSPVGVLLIVSDPSNGEITLTSNMEPGQPEELIGWLAEQHATGAYEVVEERVQ